MILEVESLEVRYGDVTAVRKVDLAVEQQPPVVGGPTLLEQPRALVEVHLLPGGGEVGDLVVGEAVQQCERAQVVVQHQVLAR